MNKILVAIPTGETARYARFYDHISQVKLPPNSFISYVRGHSPARGRNVLIKMALDNDFTHIFFVDDDIVLPPDSLEKLLIHDKDMVTGLYLHRNFPHKAIIFDVALRDGRCVYHFLDDEKEEKLVSIVAAGLGCCLIKTDVFKNMAPPWITLGELEKDHWCDDISFFIRARNRGYQLYCDLSVQCGHMATVVITPMLENGNWKIGYETAGTAQVIFPMVPLSNEEKEQLEKELCLLQGE